MLIFPVWALESSRAEQAASVEASSQRWETGIGGEDIGNYSTSKQVEVTIREVVEVTITSLSIIKAKATIGTQQRLNRAVASTGS